MLSYVTLIVFTYYANVFAEDCPINRYLTSGEHQKVETLDYPRHYENNVNCSWEVTAPDNHRVLLTFYDLELESCCDFLEIGNGDGGLDIAELSGSSNPGSFRSTGNVMWLRFTTDGSVTRHGFEGYVKAVHKDDLCRFVCRGGFCLNNYDVCNGVHDCYYGEDENDCSTDNPSSYYQYHPWWYSYGHATEFPYGSDFPDYYGTDYSSYYGMSYPSDCPINRHLTSGEHQKVETSDYPRHYENNVNCYWEVAAPENHRVLLTFYDFDLEGCCDFLVIGNGDGDIIATLSGSSNPGSFRSTGNVMWLRFTTDLGVTRHGFEGYVKAVHKDDLCRFVCRGGFCLNNDDVCNDVQDCYYGEDEHDCSTDNPSSYYHSWSYWYWHEHATEFPYGSNFPDYYGTDYSSYYGMSYPSDCQSIVEMLASGEHQAIESLNFPDHYLNDLDCLWVFTAEANHQILITFYEFQLESGYDFLVIGNEDLDAGPIATLSGQSNPGTFRSTDNVMWLRLFTSDRYISYDGFNATVISVADDDLCGFACRDGQCLDELMVCNGVSDCVYGEDELCSSTDYHSTDDGTSSLYLYLPEFEFTLDVIRSLGSGEHQMMESPNYPEYENNLDCYWVFTAPENHQVLLTFYDFELQSGSDYLTIANEGSDIIAQVSGSRNIGSFRSTGNLMWLRFTSDGSGTDRGFIAVMKSVIEDDPCTFVCRDGLCLTENNVCNNAEDCSSGEDEQYCSTNYEYVQDCLPVVENLASGDTQLIESVNYPGNYVNNLEDCYWEFTALENHQLLLTFYDFDLERCCDFLVIGYGGGSGGAVAKISGSSNPDSFRSTDNVMWLRFTTDEVVTGGGFNAYVKAVPEDYDCGFVCRVGPCLQDVDVCNGIVDCFYGEDEVDCPTLGVTEDAESSTLALPLSIVSASLVLFIAVILYIVFRMGKLRCSGRREGNSTESTTAPVYETPTPRAKDQDQTYMGVELKPIEVSRISGQNSYSPSPSLYEVPADASQSDYAFMNEVVSTEPVYVNPHM